MIDDIVALLGQAEAALGVWESTLSRVEEELLPQQDHVLVQTTALLERHRILQERYRVLRVKIVRFKTQYLSRITKVFVALGYRRQIRFEESINGWYAFNGEPPIQTGDPERIRLHGSAGDPSRSCGQLVRDTEYRGLYLPLVTLMWREIAAFPSRVIEETAKSESLLVALQEEFEAIRKILFETPPEELQ